MTHYGSHETVSVDDPEGRGTCHAMAMVLKWLLPFLAHLTQPWCLSRRAPLLKTSRSSRSHVLHEPRQNRISFLVRRATSHPYSQICG